jgi:hypothetical protein
MTPPGKQVSVRVYLKAPREANTYSAYFKIVDEKGNLCYPTLAPLEATLTVIDAAELRALTSKG